MASQNKQRNAHKRRALTDGKIKIIIQRVYGLKPFERLKAARLAPQGQ
jgi:hypothetical protein